MINESETVEILIEKCLEFTFENYCLRSNSSERKYGGFDSPEWNTFKIRSRNFIHSVASSESSAVNLIDTSLAIRTEGNCSDRFELQRGGILKSLYNIRDSLIDDQFGELKKVDTSTESKLFTNSIFIVHGHDEQLKIDVERFLHEVGLKPIVLHREADKGQTIIEKFEEHSDVGYAFILLTPDDICYSAKEASLNEANRSFEYRARPNVIFEFGYFVGKLGRDRVCCIYKGNVTVPSDLNGLIYKSITCSIDEQGMSILRELKAAGYKVSL
jgi:predicted nucleotide-binding protein